MPKDVYWRILKQNAVDNRVDIAKIARYFNVSQAAAINRGKFLGYLV